MAFTVIPIRLRHGLRALAGGRLFTVVAVVCLALAIATNTTMFSVFDAMFLRPLPFQDPDELVAIQGRHPRTGARVAMWLDDVRELAVPSLESVAAYAGRTATLADGSAAERVYVQAVTANLFAMLGKAPQRGHGFDASHDRALAPADVLISDSLWRRRYQQDESVVGRAIRLDDVPYTIVGVMPPQFKFPRTSEIWIPIGSPLVASAPRSVQLIGRLAAGASVDRANAELSSRVLPEQAAGRGAVRPSRTPAARTYASTVIGGEERTITGALLGATTVLLLLACVNVGNLLLARGAYRRREMAVRASLGANRGHIIRQLLTESVLLALVAAALALPLAAYGIRWVHDAVPPTEPLGPYYVDWSLDLRTFLYAIGVALVTGLGFGLAPAFSAAGRQLVSPLRDTAGATSSRFQRRVHSALIVVQVALALVLLAGASLFVRTYAGQRRIALGFTTEHLMTMRVYFAGAAWDEESARARAVDEIARRLETLAGAQASTVTDLVPLDDQGGSDAPAAIEGRAFEESRAPTVHYAGVAGRWPETFAVPVTGRTFSDHELQDKAPVALVNQKLAQAFWPGEDPLGRRFRLADEESNPWLTVIGVVPDIRTVKLDESDQTPPTAYLPHRFVSTRNWGIVVRAIAQPHSVVAGVRDAVRSVDPGLALFDVYPMEQVRWLSYWMYVMWGTMFGVFGLIALFIAAVGVYGVVFYTVGQRTREIGLRVALGARRTQVVGPMLRQVALLAGLGLAIGLPVAVAVTPVVESLLLGVSPNDPAGYAAVALLLTVIAIGAAWLPAWRASAVDPMVALRDQ